MGKLSRFSARLNSLPGICSDIGVGIRLASKLPSFLKKHMSPEESRAAVRYRLGRRETNFLEIVQKGIFQRSTNPCRELLRQAGCEFGDIRTLVKEEGVEGALQALFKHGVYLNVEEFKGRQPIIRGSFKMQAHPGLFRNPFSTAHLIAQTSGSGGPRTLISIDLAKVGNEASAVQAALHARTDDDKFTSVWMGPGGPDFWIILYLCRMGNPPVRWFVRGGDPANANLSWRLRTRMMRQGSRIAGVQIPKPTYVPYDDPLPIARWMAGLLKYGKTPYLWNLASSAVRICQAAYDENISLEGAKFFMSGEPITEARLRVVANVGAEGIPYYATNEAGVIGLGCAHPETADDVHLCTDLFAVIQPGTDSEGVPPQAIFLTPLEKKAPFIILNFSMGDQAVMTMRKCECSMEHLGWKTHLHTIRSYEKLTTAGITLLDIDVIHVLEELLPGRFGGGPADYQLVEDEKDGQPFLTILVSPAVGPVETSDVIETFLKGIGAGNSRLWRTPGFLRVEKKEPILGASGKILHLHKNAGGHTSLVRD